MTPAPSPSLLGGEPSPSHWFSARGEDVSSRFITILRETERYRKIPNVTMAFVTCGQVLSAA